MNRTLDKPSNGVVHDGIKWGKSSSVIDVSSGQTNGGSNEMKAATRLLKIHSINQGTQFSKKQPHPCPVGSVIYFVGGLFHRGTNAF